MTTPLLELSKLEITRYRPDIKFVPDKGTQEDEIDLGIGVFDIFILKRFDFYLFPYVQIKCILTPKNVRRLQNEYENGSIFISLEKFTYSPDEDLEGDQTGEMYWENAEFSILKMDKTPIPTSPEKPDTEDSIIASIDMELVPRAALEIGRKVNNRIFHSVKLIDVLATLFKERLPATKYRYLISPPDSSKTYDNIVVPPLPLSELVKYLNEVHGFYKNTLIFFLDVDTGYLLSASKTLEDKNLLPTKDVQIELFGYPQGVGGYGINNGGFNDTESKVYHIRTSYEPNLEYRNSTLNETLGEKIKFIRDSMEILHMRGNEDEPRLGGKRGDEKERIVWQRYDNDFYSDLVVSKKREQDYQLTIIGEGIDLNYLAPHLPYRVVSGFEELSSLEGNWRPIVADIRLTKEPESREPMTAYFNMSMVKRPVS